MIRRDGSFSIDQLVSIFAPHWTDRVQLEGVVEPHRRTVLNRYVRDHDRTWTSYTEQWHESNTVELAKRGTWGRVDIHSISADYAMTYGVLDGGGFPFHELKPMLVAEKAKMVEGYQNSVQAARALEPDAYDALITDKRYASRRPKKGASAAAVQKTDDIRELFQGALGSLPALWELSVEVAAAAKANDTVRVAGACVPRPRATDDAPLSLAQAANREALISAAITTLESFLL